jgi:hypothetical protein
MIDVYGDDIIIPVNYTDAVVDTLESYGLKVNIDKSFRFSQFRESCGGDFYDGVDVKPIYAREVPHDGPRRWTASEVMSWVSTADQFYMAGKWHVAQVIRSMLESVLRLRIPRSRSRGTGVFFYSLLFDTDLRWNPRLCGWQQKRIVYHPTKKKDDIDGHAIACLNKWSQSIARAQLHHGAPRPQETAGRRAYNHDDIGLARTWSLEERWNQVSRRPGYLSIATESDRHQARDSASAPFSTRSEASGRRRYSSPELFEYLRLHALRDSEMVERSSLDFSSSAKRGGFKSKHRWVMTLS